MKFEGFDKKLNS